MKTVLAVLGALAVLAVVLVVGGGYFAYKKGSSALVQVEQRQVDQFIATKHPAEPVANSLHRLVNAVKLHPSWTTTMLLGSAMSVMQNRGTVTDEQAKMLDEAAQLAEQGDVTKEQIAAFMKKYENVMPGRSYPQRPG
jgi:hypothetical protein